MVAFYENLWQRRMSKVEALRQAQLAMLRGTIRLPDLPESSGDEPRPVYLWAGWMINGDWR
jgi:CHAT domain-containing protein